MNCTIAQSNIAQTQPAGTSHVIVAGSNIVAGSIIASGAVLSATVTLDQAQAALRTAMDARRAAEVRLHRCKTTTSPAARGYVVTMQEQETLAKQLRQEVERLSRQPEAAELAARFGDRRLCKYVAVSDKGHDICDIARINQVRIAFFTLALDAGMTVIAPMVYSFDMPDGSGRVAVEVK